MLKAKHEYANHQHQHRHDKNFVIAQFIKIKLNH